MNPGQKPRRTYGVRLQCLVGLGLPVGLVASGRTLARFFVLAFLVAFVLLVFSYVVSPPEVSSGPDLFHFVLPILDHAPDGRAGIRGRICTLLICKFGRRKRLFYMADSSGFVAQWRCLLSGNVVVLMCPLSRPICLVITASQPKKWLWPVLRDGHKPLCPPGAVGGFQEVWILDAMPPKITDYDNFVICYLIFLPQESAQHALICRDAAAFLVVAAGRFPAQLRCEGPHGFVFQQQPGRVPRLGQRL